MPLIKVPKDNRHLLEPFEVAMMIEKAPTLRDKSIISLYYITGLRAKEPLTISKDDIVMDDKWLHIKVMREKKSQDVLIPFPSVLSIALGTNHLHWIIEQWQSANDIRYIYCDKKLQKTNKDTKAVTKWVERIEKNDKIVWYYAKNLDTARVYIWKMLKRTNPDSWIHLFRHTRNDSFRRKGKSKEQRKAWFGWKDDRSPDTYSHPDEKDIKELGESIE